MKILLSFVVALSSFSAAADIMEGFDSLGGNDELFDQARSLAPESEIRIVQDRIVKREQRHELAPQLASFLGGDAYLKTDTVGLTYHYHVNHKWSLAGDYFYAFNSLSQEAENLIENDEKVPDIDEPLQGYMLRANWYPIYGKMSFGDIGVAQFDIYLTGGLGNIELRSKSTPTYTAGAGLAAWLSQHLTARVELRYQTYEVQRKSAGPQDLSLTILGISVGYLM